MNVKSRGFNITLYSKINMILIWISTRMVMLIRMRALVVPVQLVLITNLDGHVNV